MRNRWISVLLVQTVALVAAVNAWAADFTQADLEKMVREIEAIAPKNPNFTYPIRCRIEDKDVVNAYAWAPKGEDGKPQAEVVLLTGLIKYTKGDKRIIRAVLAHEVAHLSCSHVRGMVPMAQDLSNLWTRQQEMEADLAGAGYLQRLGYSKQDMMDMLFMLDSLNDRRGSWLPGLTSTHPTPKARAAEIADNPSVLRALVQFDVALAYLENRQYRPAADLFKDAVKKEPKLVEAEVNAGQALLMDYYQNIPGAVADKWLRPDFGPVLSEPLPRGKDPEIRAADRERYKLALDQLALAVKANLTNYRAPELLALAQILHPDGDKAEIQKGINALKSMMANRADHDKLRLANNIAVGFHRMGIETDAVQAIVDVQSKTRSFLPAVGENLSRLSITGIPKESKQITLDVIYTWLKETPKANDNWDKGFSKFQALCKELSIQEPKIEAKPIYLCQVVSMNIGGKDLGLLQSLDTFANAFGAAELKLKFIDKFPDLNEYRWKSGGISIFTERGSVMRITTSEPGSYVLLKPIDESLRDSLKVSVGMTEAELKQILNIDGLKPRPLAKGGQVEDWLYIPGLQMGVRMAAGKVDAITITAVDGE